METEPTPPQRRGDEQVAQESALEANDDYEWVEALLDQFQLSGKPIRELHAAWKAVVALATA